MIYAVRTYFRGNQTLVEFANIKAMERAAVDLGNGFELRRTSRQRAYSWISQGKDNETSLSVDDVTCPEVAP